MSNLDSRQTVLFQVRHPRESGDPFRQETFKPLQDRHSLLLMDPRFRGDDVTPLLEGGTP